MVADTGIFIEHLPAKDKLSTSLYKISENSEYTLDTRDIPDDIYFLHIKDDKEIIKKQIIVKH